MSGIAVVLFVLALPAQVPQSFPDPRTGPWECVDSTGVHGIFFEGDAVHLQIYVYERRTGGKPLGGYFGLDPRYYAGPDKATFLDNRLTIHFETKTVPNRPPFDLDVKFDPARHRWIGSWSDCIVEGGATLERPYPLIESTQSPLVGDWKEEKVSTPQTQGWPDSTAFLHVRQSIDGQILAWLTDIGGRTTKLHLGNDNNTITLNPNNYVGRNSRYEGHLSADRTTITGQWIRESLGSYPRNYRLDRTTPRPSAAQRGLGLWPKLGIAFGVSCFIGLVSVALRRRRRNLE